MVTKKLMNSLYWYPNSIDIAYNYVNEQVTSVILLLIVFKLISM